MVGHLNKMRKRQKQWERLWNGIQQEWHQNNAKKKDGEINKVLHDSKKLKVKNWTRLVKG